MPCNITFTPIGATEPITLTEAEWITFLATPDENGKTEYDKLTEKLAGTDNALPPITPPKAPKKEAAPSEGGKKLMRGVTKQFLKENPSLAEILSEDAIYYDQMPNKLSEAEARKIIEVTPIDYLEKGIRDLNNGMNGAVRNIIAQLIIKEYDRLGRSQDAIALREWLAFASTDFGQFNQANWKLPTLSPATEVFAVSQAIKKINQERAEKDGKPKKIAKEFKKANKEAAKEAVEKVQGKINKITQSPNRKSPTYGSKNKLVTKENYDKLLKDLNKMTFAAALPVQLIPIGVYHIEAGTRNFIAFSEAIIEAVGEKVKPFLTDLYNAAIDKVDTEINEARGKKWKDKLEAALARADRKGIEKAIANLQNIAKEDGLWGKYRDMAAKRLKNISLEQTSTDIRENAALEDFTNGLVRNMQAKIIESLPESERISKPLRSSIEVIGDAYKNLDKYADVWEKTKAEFQEKYKDNEQALEAIDAYFGDILATPFSQKEITKAVIKGLKDEGETIAKVAQQHYTIYDATKRSLIEKLTEEAGLTEEQAKELGDAISKEFDRLALEKKQQILATIFSKKERGKNQIKNLESELIRLTNLGAFSDDALVSAYAEKMGWATLTPENIKEIERLANIVERTADGLKKASAIEDLLGYQAKLKGVSLIDVMFSVWYANLLSGYNTQIVNAASGLYNTFAVFGIATLRRPKSVPFLVNGWLNGIKQGMLEAKSTLVTGYSPLRGRVEVPSTLELYPFKGGSINPANYLKYVRRIMAATDVFIAGGLKEMRAYQWARMMAVNDGKLEPSVNTRQRALEYLRKDDNSINETKHLAALELQKEIEEINNEPISQKEKDAKINKAKNDEGRRVFELIEMGRGSEIIEESANFAARSTFNYKTEGLLGGLVTSINNFIEKNNKTKLLKFVVPFTTIVANVANEALNYTPVGYIRGMGNGSISNMPRKDFEDMSETRQAEFKAELKTKALIGLALTTAVAMLTTLKGDDDDEPILQITANGTGDYQKNELLKKDEGWQPYSLRVWNPITKKYGAWVSYRYTPLIVMFSAIGNLKDYEAYRREKLTDSQWTKLGVAMTATSRVFFDATFLASINTFLGTLFSGAAASEDNATNLYKSAVKTTKSVVVPALYTQAAKEVEAAFDIPVKQTKLNPLGMIVEDIPYLRNYFENKIDALGKEVVPDTDILVSAGEGNKIVKLLAEKKSLIKPPDIRKEVYFDTAEQKDKVMNGKQFKIYSETRGAEISKFLEDNYDELKKMDLEDAQKAISNGVSEATVIAKAKVSFSENDFKQFFGEKEKESLAQKEKKAKDTEDQIAFDEKHEVTAEEKAFRERTKGKSFDDLKFKVYLPTLKKSTDPSTDIKRYKELKWITDVQQKELENELK
jgi:hypothetical protein